MHLYTEAVTSNPLTKDSSKNDVERVISDFLKHAKDLEGGREQRRRPRAPLPVLQDPAEEEGLSDGADAE